MRLQFLVIVLMSFNSLQAQEVSFRDSIAPILQARCLRCHSGSTPKGELDLSSEKGLQEGGNSGKVIPHDGKKSLLLELIEQRKMPPKEKLSDAEIASLKNWMTAVGKWTGPDLKVLPNETSQQRAGKDWWSLQPISRPSLPSVSNNAWARQPIDSFILSKLESQHLSPAADVDRRTYLRRVKFDLLGLPPSPEEIDQFVADSSSDAYERLVDRLLASPHYVNAGAGIGSMSSGSRKVMATKPTSCGAAHGLTVTG